jgi:hypothetical protein
MEIVMRAASLSALAVAFCAPSVLSQTVEFRIVERTGQAVASPADNVLDFAVQARFNGGPALGGFYFDLRMPGELEARGTLQRGAVSNADGTYDPSIGVGNTIGRAGLPRQYAYFATVNPNFNGLINVSAGTFTNTPDQEIGLVTAFVEGQPLLGTPGIDTDSDGNPDTWSGNGSGMTPPSLATASLNPTVGADYFAQGQFIDVYRFRYTLVDFAPRTLQVRLGAVVAQQFTQFVYSGGQWGAQNTTTASTAVITSGIDIGVVPAPAASILGGIGLLAFVRRRR